LDQVSCQSARGRHLNELLTATGKKRCTAIRESHARSQTPCKK